MQPEFEYVITNTAGEQQILALNVDAGSRSLIIDPDFAPPDWALLDYQQCTHCSLTRDAHLHCPVAKNMAYYFSNISLKSSFEAVKLEVRTASRSYISSTTAQRALGSLFGLIFSLSPCPHTLPLRTMSLFHLPLANDSETLVRAASLFLLKSYLSNLKNKNIPISLDEMVEIYKNLKLLNRCFVKRFQQSESHDTNINAMILLDILARGVDMDLEEKLSVLEKYFYFDNEIYE